MALDDTKIWGETHQDLPGVSANSTNGPLNSTRRGALHVEPFGKGLYSIAELGQYFIATNPTPGTGIAGIAAADGNNDEENLVYVYNADTASGGKRIYLDFLKLAVTAAGANGTNISFVSKIDNMVRYTSGGSAITELNTNMDSSASSVATIYVGALVTTAASAYQRLVGHGPIRNVITVVGDRYLVDFGGQKNIAAGLVTSGTAISHILIPHAPVVLGPGDCWMFQVNAASQSGASSYEFELGYWEL